MKTLKISLLAFLVTTMSCKKDEPAVVSPSKTQVITSSSWKIESYDFDIDGDGNVDQSQLVDSCNIDDHISFKAGGIFLYDVGVRKCDPSDSTKTTTWGFLNNESKVYCDIPANGVDTFDVMLLNDKYLFLKTALLTGSPGTMTIRFKH